MYGQDKLYKLAKDSLASPSRKRAREEKNLAKRKARRNIRGILKKHQEDFANEVEKEIWFEDEMISEDDLSENPAHWKIYEQNKICHLRIQEIVWERRGDNLGAGQRWAKKKFANTRTLDLEDGIRAKLPDTVAGRHLAGHLSYLLEYERGYYRPLTSRYYSREVETTEEQWMKIQDLKDELQSIINDGLLSNFNYIMSSSFRVLVPTPPKFEKLTPINLEEYLTFALRHYHTVRSSIDKLNRLF